MKKNILISPSVLAADFSKLGEEIQSQQETLLAGKYRSSEDLEKAYLELQSKLGEPEETEYEPKEEFLDPEEQSEEDTEESDEELMDTGM